MRSVWTWKWERRAERVNSNVWWLDVERRLLVFERFDIWGKRVEWIKREGEFFFRRLIFRNDIKVLLLTNYKCWFDLFRQRFFHEDFVFIGIAEILASIWLCRLWSELTVFSFREEWHFLFYWLCVINYKNHSNLLYL